MSDNPEFLQPDEKICIVRLECNNRNIAQLSNIIDSLCNKTPISKANSAFQINCYTYIGSRQISIISTYNRNIEAKAHFENNKAYFPETPLAHLIETPNSQIRIIFELLYAEEKNADSFETLCDPINFQYLLLLLNRLKSYNYKYNVFISSTETTNGIIFTPLLYKWVSKLRLYLYYFSGSLESNTYKNMLEQIRFLYRYETKSKNNNENLEWRRIFSLNHTMDIDVNSESFGRIMPLFPISKDSFQAIQSSIITDPVSIVSNWREGFSHLYQNYAGKLKREQTQPYVTSDNCLESLIFISTLLYIQNDNRTTLTDEEIAILHETCTDYAQGILQLMENALFHVIGSGESGCGNISIRIRKKDDIKTFLTHKGIKHFNRVNYFMELYITDLCYHSDSFCGILNKFINNVRERKANANKELKSLFEKVLEPKNCDSLSLGHLFGQDIPPFLQEYLEHTENIALHYGLQILNNVIKTGDGYLFVRSGLDDKNCLSDNNASDQQCAKYIPLSFPWKNGTAYIIYLPINLTEHLDYHDSIAVTNSDSIESTYTIIEIENLSFTDVQIATSAGEKATFVEKIFTSLNNIKLANNDTKTIYYIDCDCITNVIQYETLAKAIFLWITSTQEHPQNIALINVQNRYEVVKVFRQFALFFNRKGENSKMNEKSIFIVDKNAELDLLLHGTIQSIRRNMSYSQIYGGIDGKAIEIIKHLATRED